MPRSVSRQWLPVSAGLMRRGGRSPGAPGGGGGPVQVWDDLTALSGYAFARSTVATDGHSAIDSADVDDYAIDVLREVSAKLGLTGQPAYLLEGARTNHNTRSEEMDIVAFFPATGTVTRTGSIADPSGGTTAARIQTASGTNFLNGATSGVTTGIPHMCSVFTQQGAGSGSWQMTNLNPLVARGGTSPAAWTRHDWPITPSSSISWRIMEYADRSANGGVVAGNRDANLWGVQTEAGAFASSYIRSTAGAATLRDFDDLTVTLPADWCSDTLTVEYRPLHTSAEHVTSAATMRLIDDGTHRLSLVIDSGASKIQLITTGGTYLSPALTYSAGDVARVEVDWSALELDVSVNATPVTTTSITGAWVSGGTAQIGSTSANTENAFGVISIGGLR